VCGSSPRHGREAGVAHAHRLAPEVAHPEELRVLPRQFELKLDTWVTMHEDLRSSPRCKATFDALVNGLALHAH